MTGTRTRKDERRAEAKVRQEVYDRLTLDERIELARSRYGNSARELERLMGKKKKQERER